MLIWRNRSTTFSQVLHFYRPWKWIVKPFASLFFFKENTNIQLFWQRLSHRSVKAYTTMSIGIMGSKSLVLLDWVSRWFRNKEREKKNEYTCFCCFLPPRWNTLRFNQATVKTTVTHNNFRHCRVSFPLFVRQPFSKLCMVQPSSTALHFITIHYVKYCANEYR